MVGPSDASVPVPIHIVPKADTESLSQDRASPPTASIAANPSTPLSLTGRWHHRARGSRCVHPRARPCGWADRVRSVGIITPLGTRCCRRCTRSAPRRPVGARGYSGRRVWFRRSRNRPPQRYRFASYSFARRTSRPLISLLQPAARCLHLSSVLPLCTTARPPPRWASESSSR